MCKSIPRIKRVVRVVVLNDNREILFVRQKTRQLWQFPGGIINAHEKPYRAAMREVREETQLRLKRVASIRTETVLTGVIKEEISTFLGTMGKTKTMAPDGKEIDMLAWVSIEQAFTLALTDTTKFLLSNLAVIKLFV